MTDPVQLSQQQPLQLQIQPPPAQLPGFDIYAMLMQAHTASIQNSQDMRNHLRECNDRDARNEKMFTETKATIVKMFDKLELNKNELQKNLLETTTKISDDVNASNKWIYMIVGGITLLGALFDKFPIEHLLGNGG